ncbi:MAG TPA: ComEC/Rec2 family competence protein [bacterium]|jgi:competence protein ComEC|nr:ComEC/Rec2 family competence protein [bacterium]HOG38755.1 ComEC/Rec2 family competence protein [bacterium]HQI03593.1 ComEC/Rec2 family competence protein [bacterium]
MNKVLRNIILCITFLIGIAIACFSNISIEKNYIICAIIIFFLLFIILKNSKINIIFLMFIFLCLGFYRTDIVKINRNDDTKIWYYTGKTLKIKGVVGALPDERINYQKLTIETSEILEPKKKISGNLLVTTDLYPEYNYGDEVIFDCELKRPEKIENFSYDKYLMKQNIYSICSSRNIEIISQKNGNKIITLIYGLRKNLFSHSDYIWPEPYSSFVNGLLFGKNIVSEEIKNDFKRIGISHIIVVSGMHVSIISMVCLNLSISTGINRKKSFLLICFIVIGFVFLSGLGASTIRAAIMAIILMFSQNIGKIMKNSLLLSYSTFIIAVINPYTIFYDVGFQLSFFATYGLMYISPLIEKYFEFLPEQLEIRSSLTSSIAAIISTTPILIYQFRQLSIVSPISNLLILPLISINMLVAFFAVIFSYINLNFAKIIGFFNYANLQLMIKTANELSKISFANISINNFSLFFMLFSYILIFYFVFRKTKKLYD